MNRAFILRVMDDEGLILEVVEKSKVYSSLHVAPQDVVCGTHYKVPSTLSNLWNRA